MGRRKFKAHAATAGLLLRRYLGTAASTRSRSGPQVSGDSLRERNRRLRQRLSFRDYPPSPALVAARVRNEAQMYR